MREVNEFNMLPMMKNRNAKVHAFVTPMIP